MVLGNGGKSPRTRDGGGRAPYEKGVHDEVHEAGNHVDAAAISGLIRRRRCRDFYSNFRADARARDQGAHRYQVGRLRDPDPTNPNKHHDEVRHNVPLPMFCRPRTRTISWPCQWRKLKMEKPARDETENYGT